jgi:hypothetical protein
MPRFLLLLVALLAAGYAGCSASKQRLATEQLVISDSVDRSVSKIDFSPLAGRKVYLDTKYMLASRPSGFVSPEYVISSIRQQMLAYDLRLQEKPEDAEIIVEGRCGVLGNDGHESAFGIPGGSAASAAATSFTGTPIPPILPELSLAKRMDQLGATKVAVFAYDRETREPIWQSGISTQISTAKDFYVLGIGPIQRGSIYGGTRFAGDQLKPFDPVFARRDPDPIDAFRSELNFSKDHAVADEAGENVIGAGHVEPGRPPDSMQPSVGPPGRNAPQPVPDNLNWAPLPPVQ